MPSYFTPETIKFLRGLKKNNDREWFNARRDIYERSVKAPMLALIEDINAKLIPIAPDHLKPANKVMMRIYRDTRFSKNKLPYKTHISAWWSRHGMDKDSSAGYYMHVSPTEVFIAAGVYMPERESLLRIRTWMADNHTHYRKLLKKALSGTHGFAGTSAPELTRMPKGFPAEHPADELLRAKSWEMHISLPADLALEATLATDLVKRMKTATPIVNTLNEAILSGAPQREERPRRPLF